jgi:DNA-binding GntR family transcriptional regulator
MGFPSTLGERARPHTAGGAPQQTRGARAYDFIRNRLIAGHYRPGERIDVPEIADALRISRQPIMAALLQLATEDLVQVTPQVGCVAALYTAEEWADFHRFFASGEGLITQLATERATEQELAALRAQSREVERGLRALNKPSEYAREYRRLNQVFHSRIHLMAHSPIIDRRLAALWDRADYYISTLGHSRAFTERVPTAIKEHDQICDAMQQRNASAARKLMEAHILAQVSAGL